MILFGAKASFNWFSIVIVNVFCIGKTLPVGLRLNV